MLESGRMDIPQAIKSYPVLSAAASFAYAGMGQILCGKLKRGVLLLVVTSLTYWTYNFLVAATAALQIPMGGPWQLIYSIGSIVGLLIRVWAVYDAYRIANSLKTSEID